MAWKYVQYNGETGKRRTVEGGGGGGGNVDDVLVNGISVVDENHNAQIVSYKEVTQAEYNALPSSKETDGILYCIKDVGDADSFPPLIYSDEEREIGVWRDGKPVYQKTYDLGSDTSISYNSWTEVNATYPTDCELIIRVDCNTSGGTYASGISVGRKANGKFEMQTGRNGNAQNIRYFTILYTKSSDTAGSGIWNQQGALSHHYSTSEKVIGTWIDGKPLYEKTVHIGAMTKDTSWHSTNHNISNFKDLIDMKGIAKGSGEWYSFNVFRPVTSIGIMLYATTTYIGYMNNYSDNISDSYVTIQYTKTTD